jgi:uncharacterized membrane protein
MGSKYLFSYKSRYWGLILILAHILVMHIWRRSFPGNASREMHGIPDNSALFNSGHLFFIATSLLVLAGLFLIAFSKEKVEDEQIGQLRLDSLRWAIYFYYLTLVLSIVFTNGIDYIDILRLNTWVPLVFFIVRFRWVIFRLNRSLV